MRSRSPLPGVLYAEDFDAPEPRVAARPEPAQAPAPPVVLEPTFSLLDLQNAAEHAREQERQAAAAAAERTESALRTDALVRIADSLSQARDQAAGVAAEAADRVAATLLAAVAAVLPAFAATRGRQEIAALLRLLMPAMSNEPVLSIRVHPQAVEALQAEIGDVVEAGRTRIDWIAAETMPPGDVVVRWQDGTLTRDLAALCHQVTTLLMPEPLPESPNAD